MSQPGSIEEAFGELLPQVAENETPVLLAMLERSAAGYYERWAADSSDPTLRAGLLACAAREVEIAAFIESITPGAAAMVADLHARLPDLEDRYAAVMAGRTTRDQWRIQATGELAGGDYMQRFADATSGAVAARFAALACCERANAAFLNALVDAGE